MNELWRTLWDVVRDPRISATLVLTLVVLAGLTFIGVGYWGSDGRSLVVYQLPYVLSGAVAGIALVGVGLGLLSVHFDRVAGAEERQRLSEVRADTMRLVRAVADRRTS